MEFARVPASDLRQGMTSTLRGHIDNACSDAFSDQTRQVLEHLEKVLTHKDWQGTARRSAFLRFVVQEALTGNGARLKGTIIALEVFGRAASGDHQSDAIVRVEARRLRRDLECFYAGPGQFEPIRITIPKGGYTPLFDRRTLAPSIGSACNRAPRSVTTPQPAIFVQPFSALGEDPFLQDMAQGLTHEVISGLMQYPGFRLHCLEESSAAVVTPSKDSFTVRAIVQQGMDSIKVCVRLVRAEDAQVIWSRTFLHPFTARDMILIQTELAADIADALGAPEAGLREGLIARVARAGGPSIESYLAVIAAQAYRRTHLAEAHVQTRAALERAIETDPCYPDAWAYLAFLRLDAVHFAHDTLAPQDAFDPALRAARRALALDPENVPAHLALLLIQHYSGRTEEAMATADCVLCVSPHDPDALATAGWLRIVGHADQLGLGRLEKALARSINPPPRYFRSLAVYQMMWGTPEAFLDAASRAASDGLGISAALHAVALGRLGRAQEAAETLRAMARHSPRLAQDPRGFLTPHRAHPTIVDTIVKGLHHARHLTQPRLSAHAVRGGVHC